MGITDELDSSHVMNISRATDNKKEESLLKKKETGKRKKVYSSTSRDNFYYFIETIYNNCKRYSIESSTIIQWIHDLLEFDPSLTEDSHHVSSGFEQNFTEPIEYQKTKTVKKLSSREHQALLNEREKLKFPLFPK